MAGLAARTAQLVQTLQQAGLRATADPRNAHPICAYVEPEQISPRNWCASQVTWRVLLIAPAGATADALAALDQPLSAAMAALGGIPSARLVSWSSPQTGEGLAAWELTYTDVITWPEIDATPEGR